jgi:PiT family inorganic phosphate transporter
MLYLIPSLMLGWSLGANDSANVFGPPVASRLVSYWKAVTVTAIFVVIGAVTGGAAGLETIGSLSQSTTAESAISVLGGAISVILMTIFGLPVSTSQAVVGGILGIGLIKGSVNWGVLWKIVICWVTTPIGALAIGFVMYKLIAPLFSKIKSITLQDRILVIATWIVGAYGAYSLGANNVANVTGAFVGTLLTVQQAALIGGLAIAAGSITYSKKVMMTVGKKLIELDHFSSLISIFAEAVTVWIYALIGVPVSTSQAIVGGVLGAGIARGTNLANFVTLYRILFGWVGTPTIAGLISAGLYVLIF